MAATIKDVAKRAGVSTATVSHVLNKTRRVSQELVDRVDLAIKELGYYPNLLVGSLRNKQTHTVGLVLPSISNETFGLLAETIQKKLFGLGYNLIICNTSYNLEIEREAFNTLLMKKADAIVAIPTCREGDKLAEIRDRGIPIVLIDRVIPGLGVDTVRMDNFKGTKDAMEHLIALGHRSIGYIDRKTDHSHSLEQKAGYRKALEESALGFDENRIIRAEGFGYISGIASVKALMKKAPDLTALLAYYDITALGAIRGLSDLGYEVPKDVLVIGCDAMPFTEVTMPRLTTISFPVQQIANVACDMLIKRLESNERVAPRDVIIVPKLIIGDSTTEPRNQKGAKS